MMNNNIKNKKILVLIEFFLKLTPYVLAFGVYVIITMLMFWGTSSIEGGTVSANPLKLHYLNDWILIGALVTSLVIGGIYIVLIFSRKSLRTFTDYFGTLLVMLTLLSWIGLLMLDNSKITIASIKKMELSVYVFNGLAIFLSVIAIIWCCYRTRRIFKKSNWWLLIVMVPYMVVAYTAGETIFGLKAIQNLDGYSAKSLTNFLKAMGNADVNLANQSFYTIVTFTIFICFFYVGGNISGIVYRKEKERCRRRIEKIKERQRKG